MADGFYEVLGLTPDCSQEDIKKSYKKLAMQYHPDVNSNPEAEEKFKEISEAYSVLSDTNKRRQYDRNGYVNPRNGNSVNAEDLFQSFFRNFGGFNGFDNDRQAKAHSKDITGVVNISLEQAFSGMKTPVSYERLVVCRDCSGTGDKSRIDKKCKHCNGAGVITQSQGFFSMSSTCGACRGRGNTGIDPCNACQGSGSSKESVNTNVNVPAGVDSGNILKISGGGNFVNGATGDLFLEVRVANHQSIKRRGPDLFNAINVDYVIAILGGEIHFEDFIGETDIKIPPGSQNGHVVQSSGMGMPSGSGRGKLYSTINVILPEKVTDEQRQLLEQIRSLNATD